MRRTGSSTNVGGFVQNDYAANGVTREARHAAAKKEAVKIGKAPKVSSQELTREARFADHLRRNSAKPEIGVVKNGSVSAPKPDYLANA